MAQITYTTPLRYSERGPWLIDAEKLKELDAIYERNIEKINNVYKKNREEENSKTEEEFSKSIKDSELTEKEVERMRKSLLPFSHTFYEDCKCNITIELPTGKTVICSSFKEIFS